MKAIPIYDATVPVACTIGDDEKAERIAQLARMRDALVAFERTEHGMLLRFEPDAEADLRAFAVDEKRCCQFWGFDVIAADDGLTLRWDGPPTATELIDRFVDYFEGRADIDVIAGLL